jgi:hypothetical protein
MEGGKNFQSGVQAARGHFIFVSAVDDICDKNFYCEAVKILNEKETVCAVSPMSRFENNSHGNEPIGFELLGDTEERVRNLFHNIRVSHGIFYSLIRRNVATALYRDFAKDCSFIGDDWLFNLKLAVEGEVYRTHNSECTFGMLGISRGSRYLINQNVNWIRQVFPHFDLTVNIVRLVKGQERTIKIILLRFAISLLIGNVHRYVFTFKQRKNISKAKVER